MKTPAASPDVLARALQKQAAGYGTTNTEKKALADYDRGKLVPASFRVPSAPTQDEEPGRAGRIAVEDVQGLPDALRKIRSGEDTDVITSLDTAGATFEEFTICDSGVPATRWWPTWTSDPS